MAAHQERELADRVRLCTDRGRLAPEARGWSRKPLHVCNLSGAWPRKKKWNFWLVTGPECAFCMALAHVDYIGLAFGFLLDFETLELVEHTVVLPLGRGCEMPPEVERSLGFRHSRMNLEFAYNDSGLRITADAPGFGRGGAMTAELDISIPSGHETLNVVIPWSESRFQFTSKQNTLPTRGRVVVGGKVYEFDPEDSFACLDFGRGIWPYHTVWNWASGSGRCGDRLIGLQFGGQWTDGTGYNENGICIDGRLHKISEDIIFDYDPADFMKPWRISASVTDAVDLTLTPFFPKRARVNLGLLGTDCTQVFGRFSGVLKLDGNEYSIRDIIGWSEEQKARW